MGFAASPNLTMRIEMAGAHRSWSGTCQLFVNFTWVLESSISSLIFAMVFFHPNITTLKKILATFVQVFCLLLFGFSCMEGEELTIFRANGRLEC